MENIKIKSNEGETNGPFGCNICAFYADVSHAQIDEIVADIEEYYDGKKYLLGLEKQPREHIHFVINFSDNEYAAYVKRVLKGKYGLNGTRSKKGSTGGFGKVRKAIENVDRMCAYTLKELNYRSNLDAEYISYLLTITFEKPDNDKNIQQECMDFVKNVICPDDISDTYTSDQYLGKKWCEPQEVACCVIKFLKTKNKDITAHTVRRYTYRYIAYHTNADEHQLYNYLFPHGV